MRKIIPFLVVGIFVLSGLGAVAQTFGEEENIISEKINISVPTIVEKEDYISLDLSEATVDSWEENKPALPVITKTYTFPFGTKIDEVEVSFSELTDIEISKPVEPSPEIHVLANIQTNKLQEPKQIIDYSDIDVYPEERFGYRTGMGLKGKDNVLYLTISLYPDQYFPQQNLINHAEKASIDIKYTLPVEPMIFGDTYDLLIIAPANFQSALEPLVNHKNNLDPPVRTKLVTLEEIPSGVGVDTQEDIKYFIKEKKEEWGITYLLLVGAGVEGEEIFPVRHAWVSSPPHEDYYPSDLYYADLYNSTGGFSNWDYDGDGKYAEYSTDIPNVDVLPDVYLGKLPANNVGEVTTVVNKIIEYKAHNKMTKKILQLGGDGVPGDAVYENEYANEKVLENLPGYTTTRLWGSHPNPDYDTKELTKQNIKKGFMDYVDFVDISGHGNQELWAVHPPNDEETWLPPETLISPYHGFLYLDYDLYMIKNNKKYPVIVFTACSNHNYMKSKNSIGWKGLAKSGGGGVVSFAESGIGHGPSGAAFVTRCIGWMEVNIFDELYNTKIVGDAWGNSITSYYTTFESSLDKEDYKTMLEFSMFGDPTLIIEDGDDPKSKPVNVPMFYGILERLAETIPYIKQLLKPIFQQILGLN